MALEFGSRDDEVLATVLIDLDLATPKQITKLLAEAGASSMPLAFAVFSHGVVPDDMREVVDGAVAALAATPGPLPTRAEAPAPTPPPEVSAAPLRTADAAPPVKRHTPLPNVPLHRPGSAVAPQNVNVPRSTPVPRSSTHRFVPKHHRGADDVDVDLGSIKEELGMGADGADGFDAGIQTALEKTVRRVLPTKVHFACYEKALAHHHGSITPVRLARDAGCSAEDALKVLEFWHEIGIMSRASKGMARFRFDDAVSAEPGMQSLRTHVAEPGWHGKLLSWIPDDNAE